MIRNKKAYDLIFRKTEPCRCRFPSCPDCKAKTKKRQNRCEIAYKCESELCAHFKRSDCLGFCVYRLRGACVNEKAQSAAMRRELEKRLSRA